MEYSKEDLMEAKKQIWGVGENMGTEESKKIWEENAQFWDNAMGLRLPRHLCFSLPHNQIVCVPTLLVVFLIVHCSGKAT